MPTPKEEHLARLKEMTKDALEVKDVTPRFKGMFYGPKGSGKTVFAVGFMKAILAKFSPPDRQDIVYVDTSEGYVSLRNHPELQEGVIVVRYRNLEYIATLLMAIKGKVAPFDKVGGIILDEFTTMAARDLEEYTLKRAPDALAPEWPDYNQGAWRGKKLVTEIYKIPNIHLIMIGHEKDKKNKEGNVVLTQPNFNPQFGDAISQDLHFIARMTAKVTRDKNNNPQYVRELQVHPTGLIEAKTRVGGLPVKVSPSQVIKRTLEWLSSPEPATEEVKASDSEEIDLSVDEDEIVKIESS